MSQQRLGWQPRSGLFLLPLSPLPREGGSKILGLGAMHPPRPSWPAKALQQHLQKAGCRLGPLRNCTWDSSSGVWRAHVERGMENDRHEGVEPRRAPEAGERRVLGSEAGQACWRILRGLQPPPQASRGPRGSPRAKAEGVRCPQPASPVFTYPLAGRLKSPYLAKSVRATLLLWPGFGPCKPAEARWAGSQFGHQSLIRRTLELGAEGGASAWP